MTGKELMQGRLLHFYMILTRDCNLKCSFCYQPEKFRAKKSMSIKTADDSIKWMFDNFDEDKIKVMLWGGEPLLNMDVVKHLLNTYPQIRFTVVTNGYVITKEIKEYLLDHSQNLHVSLSVANNQENSDTYIEDLSEAIELVAKTYGDVHHVSCNAAKMYDDYIKLEQMGVPVIRMSVPRDVDMSDELLAQIEVQWKRIVDHVYFEDKFNLGRTNFDRGIQSNLNPYTRGQKMGEMQPYFCGCGYLYTSIDVEGDVFPCDWFCGLDKYKFGNIYEDLDYETVKKFKDWHDNKDKMYNFCKDCEIPDNKLCPRAMCLAENLEKTGDLFKPQNSYCRANVLEYRVHKYLVEKANAKGVLS